MFTSFSSLSFHDIALLYFFPYLLIFDNCEFFSLLSWCRLVYQASGVCFCEWFSSSFLIYCNKRGCQNASKEILDGSGCHDALLYFHHWAKNMGWQGASLLDKGLRYPWSAMSLGYRSPLDSRNKLTIDCGFTPWWGDIAYTQDCKKGNCTDQQHMTHLYIWSCE